MNKNFLTGLAFALLVVPSLSFANCSDKTASCKALDANGTEHVIGAHTINFKGEKVHNAKSFFSGLKSGFKCQACTEGCGHTVTRAINECDAKAKSLGYAAGYIDESNLDGDGLDHVAKSAFGAAKQAAEIASKIAPVAAAL